MNANDIDFLISFFNHKTIFEFYNAVTSIPRSSEFPFFNYIGVNFKNNELCRIKLYCTTFQKFAYEQIEGLLPTLNDFKEYYPYFEESKIQSLQHTGCAFTLKADREFNFTNGFHLRIDETAHNKFTRPKHIQLSETDRKNFQGISFEYSGSQPGKRKNYYYITDETTKRLLADEWSNLSLARAKVIEYTESADSRKIIVWDDFWEDENKAEVNFSYKHANFNQIMKKEFGLQNRFTGMYFDGREFASYYSYIKDISRESFSAFDTYQFIRQKLKI